jgi:sugar phosphate permease
MNRVSMVLAIGSVTAPLIGGGLAIFSISFAYSIVAVLLLILLFGADLGLAQTAIDVKIVQIAPSESRGGVLSIHNTMKYIGQSLSPIVLGIVQNLFFKYLTRWHFSLKINLELSFNYLQE